MISTMDEILEARDPQELYNPEKPFDSVSHEILLQKLHYYDVLYPQIEIVPHQLEASGSIIKCRDGWMWCSTILMFIVYLNDFHGNITVRNMCFYANDTCVLLKPI